MRKKLIIDGNNLLHRSYWVAKTLNGKDEYKTQSHLFFFLKILRSYVNIFSPSSIIVCWDYRDKEYSNERKELFEEYKGQRKSNPEIFEHIDDLWNVLESLGVKQVYPKTKEADDIMYWLCAERYANNAILVTTDTDMFQLINPELNENIIFNPKSKIQINNVYLRQHFDVNNGREFIIRKALKGDTSDNIPGLKGIRKERVRSIIDIIGNEMKLENAKEILKPEEYEIFERNMQLMWLEPICDNKDEVSWYNEMLSKEVKPNREKFRELMIQLEFWNIVKKLDSWYHIFTSCKEEDSLSNILSTLYN